MVKIGIIGMGRMGTFHATQASLLTNVTVTALVDTNTTHISRELAPAAIHTNDYTQLFPLVDAVIIATPTPTHYQIAHDFLSRGIHVLIEKPITPTVGQAKKLFQLAQEHRCALHIGHVERFNYAFIKSQELLSNEQPELLRAVRSGPFNARVAHDSVLLDLMIHDIDLIMQLANSPIAQSQAFGVKRKSQLIDSANASIQFVSNALATITAHRTASCGTRQLIVDTATQQLVIDFGTQTVTQRSGTEVTTHTPPTDHNPLREQLHHFVRALATHTALHNAPHDLAVLRHTLMLEKEAVVQPSPAPQMHEAVIRV